MSLVENKEVYILINNKPFFDQPVKKKQEVYKKLVEMSGNNAYTSGNLPDHLYHQNYFKFVGINWMILLES